MVAIEGLFERRKTTFRQTACSASLWKRLEKAAIPLPHGGKATGVPAR